MRDGHCRTSAAPKWIVWRGRRLRAGRSRKSCGTAASCARSRPPKRTGGAVDPRSVARRDEKRSDHRPLSALAASARGARHWRRSERRFSGEWSGRPRQRRRGRTLEGDLATRTVKQRTFQVLTSNGFAQRRTTPMDARQKWNCPGPFRSSEVTPVFVSSKLRK